uniref:Transposase n=1 Tax=Steinernema glaseri TaxID=37863 RepID=A0A1I8APF7_9BILA
RYVVIQEIERTLDKTSDLFPCCIFYKTTTFSVGLTIGQIKQKL